MQERAKSNRSVVVRWSVKWNTTLGFEFMLLGYTGILRFTLALVRYPHQVYQRSIFHTKINARQIGYLRWTPCACLISAQE